MISGRYAARRDTAARPRTVSAAPPGSTGGDRLAGSVVEILRGRRGFEPYAEAGRSRLHTEAEVVDTTHLTTARAAARITEAVSRAA
jgi:hypothetical protein